MRPILPSCVLLASGAALACPPGPQVAAGRDVLAGITMGGGGALEIALTHPNIRAAVAPLCPVPPYFGDPAKPLEVAVSGVRQMIEPDSTVEDLPWAQPFFMGDVLVRSHVRVYGARNNPAPAGLKPGALPDYIAYVGSLDNSVATGRWPVPRNQDMERVLEI